MNDDSDLLKGEIQDAVDAILKDVEFPYELSNDEFQTLCQLFLAFYSIITTEQHTRSAIGRSDLDRHVDATRHAVQALFQHLSDDRFISALHAADLSLAIANKMQKHEIQKTLNLHDLTSSLDALIEVLSHLIAKAKEFDALSLAEQFAWRFKGKTPVEVKSNAELFSHFRKRHEKPELLAVQHIAQIYNHLYKKQFSVKSVENRGDTVNPEARYKGPSVRFACAVVQRLALFSLFGGTGSVEISNRIGDLWTYNKQRKRCKAKSGD